MKIKNLLDITKEVKGKNLNKINILTEKYISSNSLSFWEYQRKLLDYGIDLKKIDLSLMTDTFYDLYNSVWHILRKYKINMYAYAGTLLGFVRDGWFIPWDDDIDVAISYKELLKNYEEIKSDFSKSDIIWTKEFDMLNPSQKEKEFKSWFAFSVSHKEPFYIKVGDYIFRSFPGIDFQPMINANDDEYVKIMNEYINLLHNGNITLDAANWSTILKNNSKRNAPHIISDEIIKSNEIIEGLKTLYKKKPKTNNLNEISNAYLKTILKYDKGSNINNIIPDFGNIFQIRCSDFELVKINSGPKEINFWRPKNYANINIKFYGKNWESPPPFVTIHSLWKTKFYSSYKNLKNKIKFEE